MPVTTVTMFQSSRCCNYSAMLEHSSFSLVQVSAEWLRPSSWIANDGTPQTSLDVDANRLVLLDRAEMGAASQEEIPF